MPPRTLYFDESGFTGYNLLDPKQPIFAIASANIDEDLADEILRASFPRYQGAEFKFKGIWASNHHRVGLLTFACHLHRLENLPFIYVVNKRFALLAKIVDLLIEPYFTDFGFDFYDHGFCRKYTNYIHFGLTQFAPAELLDALLCHYQAFNRNPTRRSLIILQTRLNVMARSVEKRVRVALEPIALGAQLFEHYNDFGTFRGSLELQMTIMLAIVYHWRQKCAEDLAVVHDESSNFMRSQKVWQKITSCDVPRKRFRFGDGSIVEYPLRVISTTPMNSKDSRSIQFCDVLAGLATRHFSPCTEGRDRTFINEVFDAGLKHITYECILPDTVFPDFKRLNGPDIK
jgi:hypothetical protein